MSEQHRSRLRKQCLRSLYSFCIAVMGYDDITDEPHKAFCDFLGGASPRKQACMPRSFVKTWIGTIAYALWVTLPRLEPDEFPYEGASKDKYWRLGPNMRVLIASYVVSNAEKMLSLIRKTYESNQAMQMLFPEVIPTNFNKIRWSNQSACINRSENFTESTYEAAGIGGASTSRHYDLIIEDDLIYAKKDDFSDQELQPSGEDIDKAIGWHKLAMSLLVPGKHTHIHNIGTRWAKKDLVSYIWDHCPEYDKFIRGAVNLKELEETGDWEKCTPTWKDCYDIPQLRIIRNEQGPYMFATQYLLSPSSPEEKLFKPEWLSYYEKDDEIPEGSRIFTTVDLSEWTDSKRKSDCDGVVLTCAWSSNNHMWIKHYDKGRFDPTEIITLCAKHWTQFKPEHIGIESIYYQKAIAHFARKEMEAGRIPYMSITQLKPEGNVSKEIRIRALEPLASNLAIHCKKEHKAWIEEFLEYVPNSRLCKKDLLDTASYQIQIARPGAPKAIDKGPRQTFVFESKPFDDGTWMDKLVNRDSKRDVFGNPTNADALENEIGIMLNDIMMPSIGDGD